MPEPSALALAFAGPFLEKGPMLLGRAKVAVIAAGTALLSACPILTGKVRADDKAWLNTKCSPEARATARGLGVEPTADASFEDDLPNVIEHDKGTEVRDGPVVINALLQTPERGFVVLLFGNIRTGSDGASIHLDRAKRFPAGPEFRSVPSFT